MSDATLRELERLWKETGSVEAEARWLAEQVRTGRLTGEHLATAAYCRHPAAQLAIGTDTRASPDEPEFWLRALTSEALTPHAVVLWCLGGHLIPLLARGDQASAAAVLRALATLCVRARSGRIKNKKLRTRLFSEFETTYAEVLRPRSPTLGSAPADLFREIVTFGRQALEFETTPPPRRRQLHAFFPLPPSERGRWFGGAPAAGLASVVVSAHASTVEALTSARRWPSGLLRRLTGRDTDPSMVLTTARRAVALWALGRDPAGAA